MAKSASDNGVTYQKVFLRYEKWLQRSKLAENSRRSYRRGVQDYLEWLADADLARDGPLEDPHARDFGVRDWRRHLREDMKRKPATVNQKLAAVDNFYIYLGLGPADAPRDDLPQESPRALDDRGRRRLLRAIEPQPSVRNRAICAVLFYTAVRVAECAGLDVDDVAVSARKGHVVIRGKRSKTREIPLNGPARERLKDWLARRPSEADDDEKALFVNRYGNRLSTRGMWDVVHDVGEAAGLEDVSPHVLRHTALTILQREERDLVLTADIAGHKRVETTRRYTLPSREDRAAAMDSLDVEH